MTVLREGKHEFVFSEGWRAVKYDYQKKDEGFDTRFIGRVWRCGETQNHIDFVAHDGSRLYLIEIKDYRMVTDEKQACALPKHICRKLRDSIMGLLAAYRAPDAVLGDYARYLFADAGNRVATVLFIDDSGLPPTVTSYLSPETLRSAIKKQIEPLNFEVHVLLRSSMPQNAPWTVRDVTEAAA